MGDFRKLIMLENSFKKKKCEAGKMAQLVMVYATEPNDLSSIPRIHMVGEPAPTIS